MAAPRVAVSFGPFPTENDCLALWTASWDAFGKHDVTIFTRFVRIVGFPSVGCGVHGAFGALFVL